MVESWYLIEGINPEPWRASEGSIGRKNSKMFVQFHKPSSVRDYQEALASEITSLYPDSVPTERLISVRFWFWRQMGNIADATNLQKSTEDALQGILYKNDQQVKHAESCIVEQSPDTLPYVLVCIRDLPVELYLEGLTMLDKLKRAEVAPKSNLHQTTAEDIF